MPSAVRGLAVYCRVRPTTHPQETPPLRVLPETHCVEVSRPARTPLTSRGLDGNTAAPPLTSSSSARNRRGDAARSQNDVAATSTSASPAASSSGTQCYRFDGLFTADTASQETVYACTTARLIDEGVLQGVNAALLLAGGAHSGRRYTFLGGDAYDSRGVAPRAVQHLYTRARQLSRERAFAITLSVVQLVGERVVDLLAPSEVHPNTISSLSSTVGPAATASAATQLSSSLPSSGMNRSVGEEAPAAAGSVMRQATPSPNITLDGRGDVVLRDITQRECATEAEALGALFEAQETLLRAPRRGGGGRAARDALRSAPAQRSTARTPMSASSRTGGRQGKQSATTRTRGEDGEDRDGDEESGHVVVRLDVCYSSLISSETETHQARLHLVELAAMHTTVRSTTARQINQSLATLEQVLVGLQRKPNLNTEVDGGGTAEPSFSGSVTGTASSTSRHKLSGYASSSASPPPQPQQTVIPYRQSKLTTLLKGCLCGAAGGSSSSSGVSPLTSMVMHICPDQADWDLTHSTLKLAQRLTGRSLEPLSSSFRASSSHGRRGEEEGGDHTGEAYGTDEADSMATGGDTLHTQFGQGNYYSSAGAAADGQSPSYGFPSIWNAPHSATDVLQAHLARQQPTLMNAHNAARGRTGGSGGSSTTVETPSPSLAAAPSLLSAHNDGARPASVKERRGKAARGAAAATSSSSSPAAESAAMDAAVVVVVKTAEDLEDDDARSTASSSHRKGRRTSSASRSRTIPGGATTHDVSAASGPFSSSSSPATAAPVKYTPHTLDTSAGVSYGSVPASLSSSFTQQRRRVGATRIPIPVAPAAAAAASALPHLPQVPSAGSGKGGAVSSAGSVAGSGGSQVRGPAADGDGRLPGGGKPPTTTVASAGLSSSVASGSLQDIDEEVVGGAHSMAAAVSGSANPPLGRPPRSPSSAPAVAGPSTRVPAEMSSVATYGSTAVDGAGHPHRTPLVPTAATTTTAAATFQSKPRPLSGGSVRQVKPSGDTSADNGRGSPLSRTVPQMPFTTSTTTIHVPPNPHGTGGDPAITHVAAAAAAEAAFGNVSARDDRAFLRPLTASTSTPTPFSAAAALGYSNSAHTGAAGFFPCPPPSAAQRGGSAGGGAGGRAYPRRPHTATAASKTKSTPSAKALAFEVFKSTSSTNTAGGARLLHAIQRDQQELREQEEVIDALQRRVEELLSLMASENGAGAFIRVESPLGPSRRCSRRPRGTAEADMADEAATTTAAAVVAPDGVSAVGATSPMSPHAVTSPSSVCSPTARAGGSRPVSAKRKTRPRSTGRQRPLEPSGAAAPTAKENEEEEGGQRDGNHASSNNRGAAASPCTSPCDSSSGGLKSPPHVPGRPATQSTMTVEEALMLTQDALHAGMSNRMRLQRQLETRRVALLESFQTWYAQQTPTSLMAGAPPATMTTVSGPVNGWTSAHVRGDAQRGATTMTATTDRMGMGSARGNGALASQPNSYSTTSDQANRTDRSRDATVTPSATSTEAYMDVAERFMALELQRQLKAHPESAAYFVAKKGVELRHRSHREERAAYRAQPKAANVSNQ